MRPFQFIEARSAQEAVDLLMKHAQRAQLFASGADILYMLKDRIEGPAVPQPEILIGLARIKELEGIRHDAATGLWLGATTRLIDIIEHPAIQAHYSLLSQAASKVASPQLRNSTTLAGNLCQRPRCWYFRHPDILCLKKGGDKCWAVEGDNRYYHAIFEGGPSFIVHPSDVAPALVALEASIHLLGPRGKRRLPLEDFFVTPAQRVHRENVLEEAELITEITVPPPKAGTKQVFEKATVRQADEFSLAAVALAAQVEDGICRDCRIVLGSVGPRPYRALGAEDTLKGKPLTEANIQSAATAAVKDARPMSMNAYKIDLTKGLLRRSLRQIA